HQNIVQLFELVELGGEELFMVMEYIRGTDLERLLISAQKQRLRIPPWFSVHVIIEVLEGLAYAHELGARQGQPRHIVHRDVTPSNIFVSHLGETKLGDFGVAKDSARADLTRTGQLKGKLGYLSPEQIWGEAI